MYENNLNTIVGPGMFKQCEDYINTSKEVRNFTVLQQQVSKFERLIERSSAKRSGYSKQDHTCGYMYDHSNQCHQDSMNQNKNKKMGH